MKERVTQTDVAHAAGVHNTTVSLSLRNSHLIPAATRVRIQEIARSMGYTPDPALRALTAYRNSRRERRRVETLVYLTDGESMQGWRQFPAPGQHFTAAARRAEELGFHFKHLWLGEPGMNPRRLDRMLLHEDIRCVLLASRFTSGENLADINWSRLCAIRIGGTGPSVPALNQIALDAGAIMRLAFRHIQLAGYRRIGLVLPRQLDESADRAWSAAFHAEQHRCDLREAAPILYLPDRSVPATEAGTLAGWYHRHRPEVVVGLDPATRGLLQANRLAVPADVAYVDLLLQDTLRSVAGVRASCGKVGELAVEMLARQLEQNVFGPADLPTVTAVGGTWCAGASLPEKKPATADDHGLSAPVLTGNHNLVA